MPACKHGAWDYCGQCLAEYELEQPVRTGTVKQLVNQYSVKQVVDELIHERDEARAEVERWKDAADDLAGPIDRVFELRALLREWLDDAAHQRRPWATNADGRTLPERTWAALEGRGE